MPRRSTEDIHVEAVPHPWRIAGFVTAILVIAGLAFGAGYLVHSPESVAIASSADTIIVSAEVEKRSIVKQATIQGSVRAGSVLTANVAKPDGAQAAVVTEAPLKISDTANSGALLGAVSGRPRILLTLPIPLYRNLVIGDKGADVKEFQQALSALGLVSFTADGVIGQRTMEALGKLYMKVGYEPPGGKPATIIDTSEFVAIPGESARVLTIKAAGAVLDDTGELATLQTGPNTVTARADLLQIDSFSVGQTVAVRTSTGESKQGQITSLGTFSAPDADNGVTTPGQDIAVSLNADEASSLTVNGAVTVSTENASTESLAVPLVAITQDSEGTYVTLTGDEASSSNAGTHVYVTITGQSDGWAAITETPELTEGTLLSLIP